EQQARLAPGCPEVDENGARGGSLHHVPVEVRGSDIARVRVGHGTNYHRSYSAICKGRAHGASGEDTAMYLKLAKMNGLGNDFVVLDGRDRPLALAPETCRRVADRCFGIGCDQVLVLEPPAGGKAQARLRIFNADGTEAGQCGNGVRCAADFLRRHGLDTTPIVLETGDS